MMLCNGMLLLVPVNLNTYRCEFMQRITHDWCFAKGYFLLDFELILRIGKGVGVGWHGGWHGSAWVNTWVGKVWCGLAWVD